jgi:hypothetical protein
MKNVEDLQQRVNTIEQSTKALADSTSKQTEQLQSLLNNKQQPSGSLLEKKAQKQQQHKPVSMVESIKMAKAKQQHHHQQQQQRHRFRSSKH